jgi:uncharacterized membrane protein YfcA
MDLTDPLALATLLALIIAAAVLYASVGHGGASGYLAVMALMGLSPLLMKPAALAMNIAVAGLVFMRLARAGHFDVRLFLPFALGSIPLAVVGGAWTLTDTGYRLIVGMALLLAAVRLFYDQRDSEALTRPPLWVALAIGGALGLLSGLTGVGGGIYLSPLLLFLRWTHMRSNAALAAAFILVHSIAGLSGYAMSGQPCPDGLPWLVLAAFAGGMIGSELAVRRLAPVQIKKLLGVVLVIAGAKMIATT